MKIFPRHEKQACRTAGFFFLRIGLAVLAAEFFLGSAVFAQTALPASFQQSAGTLSAEQRDQLHQELSKNAKILESQSAVLKTAVKLVGPSVVCIETERPANSNQKGAQRVEEVGSGVIIEWKGKHYILTNRHVIHDAGLEAIKIYLADGRRVYAKRVWGDDLTDVGVMEIEGSELSPATLGDSEKIDVADFCLTIGSPFGLSQTVTFGIISGKGRRNLSMGKDGKISYQDFLQTDAAINPGNSGGPLVNLRGEVIGLCTAIASDSGVSEGFGFAIPSNMAMAIAKQLIEKGEVNRAAIGITLNSKFGPTMAAEIGLPRPVGALIKDIYPNSPAKAAKLQAGDVILEFNHIPIEDDGQLINVISLAEVGKKVPLTIFRDRKMIELTIELTELKKIENK